MATQIDPKELDMQAQFARIRRDMAEINQRNVQTTLEPWKLVAGGVTSGAALFAAAAAFTKLFL